MSPLLSRSLSQHTLNDFLGYLWKTGYESSSLRAPLFPDVPPALIHWHGLGLTVSIYSSGSVDAQKLLFRHTDYAEQPDLRPFLKSYYDTVNAGPKTEARSYKKIAEAEGIPVDGWLFLSDNVKGLLRFPFIISM